MSRAAPGLAAAGLAVAVISTLASVLLVRNHPDLIAYVILGPWGIALALVGTLIAGRRPENPIGWLFLLSATLVSLSSLAQAFAEGSLNSGPGELAAWLTLWLAVPASASSCGYSCCSRPAVCCRPGGRGSRASPWWAW